MVGLFTFIGLPTMWNIIVDVTGIKRVRKGQWEQYEEEIWMVWSKYQHKYSIEEMKERIKDFWKNYAVMMYSDLGEKWAKERMEQIERERLTRVWIDKDYIDAAIKEIEQLEIIESKWVLYTKIDAVGDVMNS
jgi:hypothetical protein